MGKFSGTGVGVLCPFLIEVPTALGRATQTRNLILFNWEVIICMARCQLRTNTIVGCPRTVCNLVAEFYILLSIDDDLLLSINRDDLGSAVRVTRVIDQPPKNQKKKKGRIQRVMMTRGHATRTRDFPFSLHQLPSPHRYGTNSCCRFLVARTPFHAYPPPERG
jgi:hypothetical protein